MGIRKLNTLIKQHANQASTYNNISKYRGKKFAIDCSILLYKYVYLSKLPNSHIVGFLSRARYYLKHGILPVFVFDGIPPEEKSLTIEKRKSNKDRTNERIADLEAKLKLAEDNQEKTNYMNEIEKLKSQIIYINRYHILECKELLDTIGVPYIQADGEAEKMCVYLQKNNFVDYVVTDDTDAFPFGAERVLKTSIKNNIINEINLKDILYYFKMTYPQFVDFCILCGCDYANTINYVGGITAYNLIQKHKDLESIENNTKYTIPFDIPKIRSIFMDYSEITFNETLELKSVPCDVVHAFSEKYNIKM